MKPTQELFEELFGKGFTKSKEKEPEDKLISDIQIMLDNWEKHKQRWEEKNKP